MQPNCQHWKVLALVLAVTGCAHGQKALEQPAQAGAQVHSPYESYLPQAPLETNRVEYAGFSIVRPAGWTTHPIAINDFLTNDLTAQLAIEGPEDDEYKPRFNIQRLGPNADKMYRDWLTPGRHLSDWQVLTQFQNQPALSRFLPGYGERRAVRGTCQPWLVQELTFERDGQWFSLRFDMRNADKNKPYYTEPLPIIEQYFETFKVVKREAAK